MVMVMRLLLCCCCCSCCWCNWWCSCCSSIVFAFPSRAPPVRLQEQPFASPLFKSRSFSDNRRRFWAIVVETLAIRVGALVIAVGVPSMFYAMAMHKSKTPIFSSHGLHIEYRPSACNNFVKIIKLILLPLSLFFKSENKLHFMCIRVAVHVRYLYCIRAVPTVRRTRTS